MSKGKRIFALALAALMTLMVILPTLSMLVHATNTGSEEPTEQRDFTAERNKIAELNDSYKELEAQQKKIDSQISNAKSEKQKQEAIKEQIDGQINTTTKQIELLSERIDLLNGNIEQKQVEMEQKQTQIDGTMELFKKRMRAMYIAGNNTSTIGLVLGAESYSQMLIRAEVVGRVAEHDRELLAKLDQDFRELNEIKSEIEEDKSAVEGDKAEMAEKKEELDDQFKLAQDKIHDIDAMEKAFMANKAELQKQMKQVQAQMQAIYDEINRESMNVPYTGGVMQWPSRSLSQITSSYGSRFGGSDFHTGIDIAGSGAYGTPVLAAATGTVKVANTAVTPGYGYGKYVIIDHGGGIQTLYAHCSALNVSVGQTVAVGQQIAQVGSTGWSTGPHIHFEVRKNGQSVNPLSYVGG